MEVDKSKNYRKLKKSEEDWMVSKAESAKKKKERDKQRYLKNRDHRIEMVKLWQKNNPEKAKKWAKNNREKVREISAKWSKNNPEKKGIIRKRWCENNPEKKTAISFKSWILNKEKILERSRMRTDNLSDRYIKELLIANGLSREQIESNTELIEVKRLIIKTKRLCRTSQN